MSEVLVQEFCGPGRGKSMAALGQGIRAAGQGKEVFLIQFLKQKDAETLDFLGRLEPEVKLFRFEKAEGKFEELTEEKQKEAAINMQVGWTFARKAMMTDECQVLILDEILGVLELGIITVDAMRQFLENAPEGAEIILTGQHRCEAIEDLVDEIYSIDVVKARR